MNDTTTLSAGAVAIAKSLRCMDGDCDERGQVIIDDVLLCAADALAVYQRQREADVARATVAR